MTFFVKTALGLLLSSALLCSCSATKSSVVDDAQLAKLTARERAQISETRQDRDRAELDWTAAKEQRAIAEKDIEIARSGLKISRAQLEQSELLVERASNESIPEMTAARVSADWHRARVGASQAAYDHARAHAEWTRYCAKLAHRELQLADARLELEKVRAVSGLSSVDSKELDVAKFEADLIDLEGAVARAQTRVDQTRERADRALAEKNAAQEQASALTP